MEANSEEADPSLRLSDGQVLDHLNGFLFNGFESVSGSIAWTLAAMSSKSDIQLFLVMNDLLLPKPTACSEKGPPAYDEGCMV